MQSNNLDKYWPYKTANNFLRKIHLILQVYVYNILPKIQIRLLNTEIKILKFNYINFLLNCVVLIER